MAAEPSIEDLKSRLQAVKGRADALIRKKDDLIRQSAQNDEQRQQALRELADLGHPEAADLDLEGLQALTQKLTDRLVEGVAALETATAEAERLMGILPADALDI